MIQIEFHTEQSSGHGIHPRNAIRNKMSFLLLKLKSILKSASFSTGEERAIRTAIIVHMVRSRMIGLTVTSNNSYFPHTRIILHVIKIILDQIFIFKSNGKILAKIPPATTLTADITANIDNNVMIR